MQKYLGKIDRAEFGTVYDYPFLIGLQLDFSFSDYCAVSSGCKYTVNISDLCKWEHGDREKTIVNSIENINKILKDAKVNYVSELIGKPVEIFIENHTFKDFKILIDNN